MQISLSKPELEQFVEDQVKAGYFASAEDVIAAGLARLMVDPDGDGVDEDTVAAIERAEAEFDRGEDRPFREVAAEFRKKYPGI